MANKSTPVVSNLNGSAYTDIYEMANKLRMLLIRNIETSNIKYQDEKNAIINGIYVHVTPGSNGVGTIRIDITAPKQSIYMESGISSGFGGQLSAATVDLANYLNYGGGLQKDATWLGYNPETDKIGRIDLARHPAFSFREASHFVEKAVAQFKSMYPEVMEITIRNT